MATIALDVDGPVADLMTAWLKRYNQDYHDTMLPKDVKGWDFHNYVKKECGKKIYDYLTYSLYQDVEATYGASWGVSELRERGHRVVFVTSTPTGCEGAKLDWLKRWNFLDDKGVYGDGRLYADYVECHDKSLIRADVLIDDHFGNVEKFGENAILFDAPHNHDKVWKHRAAGWGQVVEKVGVILTESSISRGTHLTEQRCPQQSARFREILDEMYQVHLSKNADYSPANILGVGEIGLATRIWDKTTRMMNLLGFDIRAELVAFGPPKNPKNETLEDTYLDLSVYGVIGRLLREGKWGR